MSSDEDLASYVRGQWVDLVDYASELCGGADQAEAAELVFGALTEVGARWPVGRAARSPDAAVRRALVRACAKRSKQGQRDRGEAFQLMEVGFADRWPDTAPAEEPVPRVEVPPL